MIAFFPTITGMLIIMFTGAYSFAQNKCSDVFSEATRSHVLIEAGAIGLQHVTGIEQLPSILQSGALKSLKGTHGADVMRAGGDAKIATVFLQAVHKLKLGRTILPYLSPGYIERPKINERGIPNALQEINPTSALLLFNTDLFYRDDWHISRGWK